MSPVHPFQEKLARAWPSAGWQDLSVLLAVSGGADSVALLRAMAGLKSAGAGRLAVAHFNHRLRGQDSDGDQAFVAALCGRLDLDCIIGGAEAAPPASTCGGLEAAARAGRYAFLQQAAESRGARFVVTAHTADDQAETVLHHVLRGTGLTGLAGMSRTRPLGPAVTLIRPLLEFRRREVLDYVSEIDQPFREDRTNQDRRFTRNRIRHELLPLLARDYSPAVVDSLVRLAAVAADAQAVINAAAGALLERAEINRDAARVTVDCRILARQDRHLVRELFVALWRRQGWPQQAMGYEAWDALAEMAMSRAEQPKRDFPGTITVERLGDRLKLHAAASDGRAGV
jgi:tRNA(Ile)-lysidine synthase